LERAPSSASAPIHYNLAAVSEAMGETEAARKHYDIAVRLAPKERRYRLEARMFERRASGAR
jgi:tetratricopeptide (TPR) repeat protein